jgi:ribonuclease D
MPLDYQYITKAHECEQAIAALSTTTMIGVDIEGDSLYHYQEKVSLIQVSGGGKHYIFDPLVLDSVLGLATLFENRSILKIFHGSEYDITSLKRDFDFKIGPIFDTALAARAIGMTQWSLKEVVSRFFNVTLSKVHQKSNWSLRPLSQGQLDYAAEDTAYLPPLYSLFMDEIQKKGREAQIREECLFLENLTWSRKPFEPNDYLRVSGAKALSLEEQKIFRELVVTRDRLASERDVPPFKVAHSSDLIKLAVEPPQDEEAYTKLVRKGQMMRDIPLWLSAIEKGQKTTEPLPKKEKSKNRPMTHGQQRLLIQLRAWRDKQAQSEGVEAAMVMTTALLQEIAKKRPSSMEVLTSIPMIHQWQINYYGTKILQEVLSTKG